MVSCAVVRTVALPVCLCLWFSRYIVCACGEGWLLGCVMRCGGGGGGMCRRGGGEWGVYWVVGIESGGVWEWWRACRLIDWLIGWWVLTRTRGEHEKGKKKYKCVNVRVMGWIIICMICKTRFVRGETPVIRLCFSERDYENRWKLHILLVQSENPPSSDTAPQQLGRSRTQKRWSAPFQQKQAIHFLLYSIDDATVKQKYTFANPASYSNQYCLLHMLYI